MSASIDFTSFNRYRDNAPETFAQKYVLVGATASGMGDAYATPRSGEAELMPGVEIAANVVNALLGVSSFSVQ